MTLIKEALGTAGKLTGSRLRVTLISPGKGSSGFYPAETLAEAAPLFTPGTHMYLDHATEHERYERPEGSLSKLVGVLETAAEVMPDGSLEATVKVFEQWQKFIAEAAPYIGVSINGTGVQDPDGTITQLTTIESVDFVTRAGRGGKITEIMESIRTQEKKKEEGEHMTVTIPKEEYAALTETAKKVTEAETKAEKLQAQIDELKAQVAAKEEELAAEKAKATEAAIKTQAQSIVEEAFTGINAPRGKARLIERALAEGEDFNAEAFKTTVLEEAAEYTVTGGKVTGMGKTTAVTESGKTTEADVLAAFNS